MKIILTEDQYNFITRRCKELNIKDSAPDSTLYAAITELWDLCDDLHRKLDRLQDTITDIKHAVTDRDTESIVNALKEMTGITPELPHYVSDMQKASADALAHFRYISEKEDSI